MAIKVVAEGIILEGPEEIGSDGAVAAFILGTRQDINYQGQRVELDDVATCEIVCAGELAAVAMRYEQGDHVLISGLLRIQLARFEIEQIVGSQFVRLEIHAEALARR